MTLLEKKKETEKLYKNRCQVCGETIDLGNGFKYSEVNHIQPIGKEHNGIDNKHSMIVPCPNHHTMFDLGIISIYAVDLYIIIKVD